MSDLRARIADALREHQRGCGQNPCPTLAALGDDQDDQPTTKEDNR